MIPDLRARLRDAANKPKEAQPACQCMVKESRTQLSELPGITTIAKYQLERLGFSSATWDITRTLFLDTETTGLRGAGTVIFLVGFGWVEGDSFVVRQLLMRDYPEEAHLLQMVAEVIAQFDCVISFNGKSFDIPLLHDRFRMARMQAAWVDVPHIDLLHVARRTWKARLGSCSLGVLETSILHITRDKDLPGAEVPERYFTYLKCGDFSLLEDVLLHNEQDIRTLAVLLLHLVNVYDAPTVQVDMLDVISVGKALDRIGQGSAARHCFRVASVSALSKQARLQLALSYRHEKAYANAADAYREMIAHGEADAKEYIALAILLEHRLFNPSAALEITEKAILRFAGGTLWHMVDQDTMNSLYRRRERLRRKIERLV